MKISTGGYIPTQYENLGIVIGDGFDRAVSISGKAIDEEVKHAQLKIALAEAQIKITADAQQLGATEILFCHVNVQKDMMVAVNSYLQRTSYPAYTVTMTGTAVKSK